MEKGAIIEHYCSRCLRDTSHNVVKVFEETFRDDYICDEYHAIVRCRGCDNTSFRYEFHDIDASNGYDEVPITVDIFPKTIKGHRYIGKSYYFPDIIKNVYYDTIKALAVDSKITAALGLRAIIEAIGLDNGSNKGNLSQKIDELTSKGLISEKSSQILHGVRFLGNDVAHRIIVPSDTQLMVALEIVEQMLISIYILPNEASLSLDTEYGDLEEIEYCIIRTLKDGRFVKGEEVTLIELLGDKYRRIQRNSDKFEEKLNQKITNDLFKGLSVSDKKKHKNAKVMQYYRIC